MVEKNRRNKPIILFSVLTLVLVGGYLWMNRGYGEVTPKTYQFSKAIYSACLKKSDEHLAKVRTLLLASDKFSIPTHERVWLEQITDLAQRGNWESAANKARRMMEDQVKN